MRVTKIEVYNTTGEAVVNTNEATYALDPDGHWGRFAPSAEIKAEVAHALAGLIKACKPTPKRRAAKKAPK